MDRGRCTRWQVLCILMGSFSRVCSGTSGVAGHLLRQRRQRNDVAASSSPAVAAAAVFRVSTLRRPSGHVSPDVAASLVPTVAAVAICCFEYVAASLVPAVALPFSVVLVVVCYMPNVTPSCALQVFLKGFRSRPPCLRSPSLFPQRVS